MEIWEVLDKNRQKTGKTVERGIVLNADEFHLVVDVWIRNDEGNYLITKRTPNKSFPNMWTICGGSAILGDTSLEAALREVKEEVGLSLTKEKGKLIKSFRRESSNLRSFKDVWLFNENINIDDVVHQIDEVSDSMWASKAKILEMIQAGLFIDVLTYLDEIDDGRGMIKLRYPIVEDAKRYFEILTGGHFEYYHATLPISVLEEERWIERRKYKRENNIEFNYSIIVENVLVGGCEIKRNSEEEGKGEIGYFIDKEYFNRGIATQVVKELEKIAKLDLNISKLEIRMDPRNIASERVAIKNNYIKVGILKKSVMFNNDLYDNLLYSKILD